MLGEAALEVVSRAYVFLSIGFPFEHIHTIKLHDKIVTLGIP